MPYVPGARIVTTPVFILTSEDTFSAGEAFAYTLQAQQRATIIGEVTRGGAHPGDMHQLGHQLQAFIPKGRPIDAVTGSNWESDGVQPDIRVPAAEALDTAHRLALNSIIDNNQSANMDVPEQRLRAEAIQALKNLDND